MTALDNIVKHYLSEFHAGRCEDAFHSLIESDSAIISELISAYGDATDIDTKVFVIEVISEFRLDSSLPFFRHSLRSDEPRIWKAALNGIVMQWFMCFLAPKTSTREGGLRKLLLKPITQ